MTVYIEKPALSLRSELASLRNQGGYQEQQFYFDGLVTNGGFDADTNWTKNTGGVASFSGTSGAEMYQSLSLPAGVYSVSVDVSGIGVTAYFNSPSISNTQVLSNGSNTFNLTHNGSYTRFTFLGGANSTPSISSVSIFASDGTDVIHTMPKGWKPSNVFEDGLLQREGALNDYEVIYDGFDYVIKPTVAPSATTQTCVIGVKA
jgi:hypothetical protein